MRERMASRSRRTLCTADKLAAGVWRFNDSSPSPLPRALAVQAFTSPIFTGCMPPDRRSGLQCLINTGISPIIRATASTSKMEIRVNRGRAGLSAVSSQPSACSYALRAQSWESDLREFGLDCAQRRWHPTVRKEKGSRPVSGAVRYPAGRKPPSPGGVRGRRFRLRNGLGTFALVVIVADPARVRLFAVRQNSVLIEIP
jgi:hypothetical protein